MPKQLNFEELDRIADDLGYADYDQAILDLYYEKSWALVPIANRFGVSGMTISNRITKHHKRKLRPKGGKRKSCHSGLAPVEKPIPVKSRWRYDDCDCENHKTQRGYSGGNSIWHQGAGV